MELRVVARLPDVELLSASQREQLRRAGITHYELRMAWRNALMEIFRRVYPDDHFFVRVVNGTGPPATHVEFFVDVAATVRASMTEQLSFSVRMAEASWLAALGTFSELIARHRTAVYS